MPTERMEEVEVVCGRCNGKGTVLQFVTKSLVAVTPLTGGVTTVAEHQPCPSCVGGANKLPVLPNSLTAALLRLGLAAEALENAEQLCRSAPSGPEYDAADKAYDVAAEAYQAAVDALAALRTARGEG